MTSPVCHVGAACVSCPVLDVVGFAPGGWAVAAGPAASAVAFGEGGALTVGEEALFASDVEGLAVLVEDDGHGAVGAGEPLDGLDRDRLVGAVQAPVPGAGGELPFGDGDPHGGGALAQESAGLNFGAGGDEFVEHVGGELFGGAWVVGDVLRRLGIGDEAGPTQTW
jgi:hypothetical protein